MDGFVAGRNTSRARLTARRCFQFSSSTGPKLPIAFPTGESRVTVGSVCIVSHRAACAKFWRPLGWE
jgi:hypothetical protein